MCFSSVNKKGNMDRDYIHKNCEYLKVLWEIAADNSVKEHIKKVQDKINFENPSSNKKVLKLDKSLFKKLRKLEKRVSKKATDFRKARIDKKLNEISVLVSKRNLLM